MARRAKKPDLGQRAAAHSREHASVELVELRLDSLLLGQLLHQVSEEELDHLVVGIALGAAEVLLPVGVQGEDHADPGVPERLGHGVESRRLLPLHPSEIRHAEPGLVDVDEPSACLDLLQVSDGILLSED